MKFALSHCSLAVSSALAAATPGADGTLTTREVVIPDGEFASHDGRPASVEGSKVAKWRNAGAPAARLIALARKLGRDIQVDYEHASEDAALKAEGRAPAAGWIKHDSLAYEPGRGTVATIEWTAPAAAQIVARQMRFMSPVFFWSLLTGDVLALKSVALTNDPAVPLPVTAAAALSAELARYIDFTDESDPNDRSMRGHHMDKTLLCFALGVAPTATDESVLAAVSALKAQAATPDPANFVATPVLSAEQAAHAATKQALAALEAQQAKAEIGVAISAAKAEGVDMTQEYEAHLVTVGEKLGVTTLRSMLASAPRNPVKAGKHQSGENKQQQGEDGQALTALTESQAAMAKLLGIDAKVYLAQINGWRERGLAV